MSRSLRGPAASRAVALLLTAVFLAAGTTLPGADALLHHWGEAARAEHHPHVEPAGGCTSHSEACTLGRTATGAGAALAQAPAVHPEPVAAAAGAPLDHGPTPRPLRGLLPSPRAPPLPVA